MFLVSGMSAVLATPGCFHASPADDDPFYAATARAAVAFAEAECECERLAALQSAPGLHESRSPAPVRQRRVLYFTADWCTACRRNVPALAALSSRGWQIGPEESCHIQTIDVDRCRDLAARYRVDAVPTWVAIDGDQERRRRYGPLDPFEIGRLYEE